ncbi:MAG: hypothetical protein WCJ55_09325 [Chloroflexales bacterium]
MKKLSTTGRAWLKGFHIVCTCAWVGAGVCMFLLNFVARPDNSHDLYVVMAALTIIDEWAVIPAAVGSLLTGLLISLLTPWGFFKWRWVAVKWGLTIAMTLFGIFYLSPWLHEMAAITVADPVGALQNKTFQSNRLLLSLSSGPMFLSMLFLVFISVIKPWSTRVKRRHAARAAALHEVPESPPSVDGNRRRGHGQLGAPSAQIGDGGDGVPGWQPGGVQPQIGGDHQRAA